MWRNKKKCSRRLFLSDGPAVLQHISYACRVCCWVRDNTGLQQPCHPVVQQNRTTPVVSLSQWLRETKFSCQSGLSLSSEHLSQRIPWSSSTRVIQRHCQEKQLIWEQLNIFKNIWMVPKREHWDSVMSFRTTFLCQQWKLTKCRKSQDILIQISVEA